MNGMILAAGLGTRLRPLTWFRAKPAIPFLNRPLIGYSVDLLRKAGIDEFIVNLHHLPETVVAATALEPGKFHFSREPEILGTGGALLQVAERLRSGTSVIVNGKVYFELDLNEVLQFHRETGAVVTLVLKPFSERDPFNPVLVDARGNILGFVKNRLPGMTPYIPSREIPANRFVFTGVHVIEPEVFQFFPEGRSDTVADIYPRLIETGLPVVGFVSNAYWCECSTPRRYLENSLEVLQRKELHGIPDKGVAGSVSRTVLGHQVSVPRSTIVEDSVIWGGVKLGADSSFKRVVVAEVAELPPGVQLEDCVVTPVTGNDGESSPARVDEEFGYAVWPLGL